MKKILVGEDSSVILNLLKKILEQQKFQFTGFKHSKQILNALQTENFDLIILDIIIPEMDGFELANAVRNSPDPVKASTPLIAITGNSKNYPMEKYTAHGFSKVLIKPLDYDIVVSTVNELLLNTRA